MAVPKKKQSKTRTAKRRATWKAEATSYSSCPQCKQPKMPHRVCGTAGTTPGARPSRSSSGVAQVVAASPEALDRALGVRFGDATLREIALTHRSYAFEQGRTATNERLEFLGDSVLGSIVTDLAFRTYPDLPEGQLAKLRAAIVNMQALAEVARGLGIGDLILLGKGEEQSGGHDKASILADALEAIFGAVYLDRGPDVARELIERLFRPGWRPTCAAKATATSRRSCRNLRLSNCGRCRTTRSTRKAPITRRRSQRPCPSQASGSALARVGPRRKRSSRPRERHMRRSVARGAGETP